jgi:hypothetical protein
MARILRNWNYVFYYWYYKRCKSTEIHSTNIINNLLYSIGSFINTQN